MVVPGFEKTMETIEKLGKVVTAAREVDEAIPNGPSLDTKEMTLALANLKATLRELDDA